MNKIIEEVEDTGVKEMTINNREGLRAKEVEVMIIEKVVVNIMPVLRSIKVTRKRNYHS